MESTYREFHQLLCIALMGYRASLNTLVEFSNPTQEDLSKSINVVCNYLMILRALAGTTAVIDHLYSVANAGRMDGSSHVAQEPWEVEECEERSEYTTEGLEAESLEDSADMDVTNADGWGPPGPAFDTPHARWLRLQVSYLTAVDNILGLSRLGAHSSGPIELVIYTTPSTGKFMAPLMPVVERTIKNTAGLCLPVKGPDGNRLTDMEMIKMAFEDLREYISPSLGRSLDLMCQGSGFNGQVHCEVALLAVMFDPTPGGFPECDTGVVGVSRHCCAVCSAVFNELTLTRSRSINILGHHKGVVPCALPEALPPSFVGFISRTFEWKLADSLRKLCILSQRSRAGSCNLKPWICGPIYSTSREGTHNPSTVRGLHRAGTCFIKFYCHIHFVLYYCVANKDKYPPD
ncbi:hypothetical protein BD779DRAFT_1799541 [Infundibulicybe gibba]|nr:hypothetical protein BD779DRAFT_1799541 [Infundibulicybe gibba]